VKTLARGEVEGSSESLPPEGNRQCPHGRDSPAGGVAAVMQAERPKDWRQALPKKARRIATRSAILLKIQSQDIRVVDDFKIGQAEDEGYDAVYKALASSEAACLPLMGETRRWRSRRATSIARR